MVARSRVEVIFSPNYQKLLGRRTNLGTGSHHSLRSFDSHTCLSLLHHTKGGGGYNDGYGDRGKFQTTIVCSLEMLSTVHCCCLLTCVFFFLNRWIWRQPGRVSKWNYQLCTLYKVASSWRLAHINLLSLSSCRYGGNSGYGDRGGYGKVRVCIVL